MKKFRLLLLDANVVIELFKQQLWDKFIAKCNVYLAQTVVDEAHFYEDSNGERQPIDLAQYINSNAITVFDPTLTEIAAFSAKFDLAYLDRLHDGELASLAYLLQQTEECRICSADKIVYRVIGNLRIKEQGISLQEILQQIGLGRTLDQWFTQDYREKWTSKGFEESQYGIGAAS